MVDLLKGIRVLSLNHFLMGPVGVQFLADLGADVIAVEPPGGAFQRKWGGADKRVDGQSMLLLTGNRNKRSLTLDLKKPEAVVIARQLIAKSDVIAENFRPGVLDKLGLGYEDAKKINPQIIYAAASGYGPDGPYVNRPGQDLLIQALSGLAMITGSREQGPRAVGVSAIDHHGAALFAAGILAALVRKARTGQGCRVDVSLLSAALDLQMESFTCYLNGQRPDDVRQPGPVAGWYYGAPYGIYATRDGHIAISLGSLEALSDALGLPLDQRIPDGEAYRRRDEASAMIAPSVAKRTTTECIALFEARGIWHAAVNDYADVVEDPQIAHNRNFQVVTGATGTPITLVSHPVRYDGEQPDVRLPPQKLGAQTEEILKELGYDARTLKHLYDTGAIGAADSHH
ncbi:CaiB/BaiF CoA transferase family protein [Bradyrhizobium niftali]|jgi:crotonobetainyl-CoA:carnitine CoA-transferase CaiB-like acyl-CoA transferase|uniref:CoA transferase n=1 Tax=Bradyrhizobium niftali TaxID=2560055 RepID=A0A4Y9LZE1_9BRAD|nr:CoA transferase [Bradyrhizobium niftali]TFV48289.1 CoA transferase [Bradyrhizobium niftali]